MKVNFDDTKENWRLWSELVQLWINKCHERPASSDKLVNEMTAHGITGASVYGQSPRPVLFYSYDENDPLVILLPKPEEVAEGQSSSSDDQPYPLPVFYNLAYDGDRKLLSKDDRKLFARCRISEYTMNNCG